MRLISKIVFTIILVYSYYIFSPNVHRINNNRITILLFIANRILNFYIVILLYHFCNMVYNGFFMFLIREIVTGFIL